MHHLWPRKEHYTYFPMVIQRFLPSKTTLTEVTNERFSMQVCRVYMSHAVPLIGKFAATVFTGKVPAPDLLTSRYLTHGASALCPSTLSRAST